MAASGHHSRQQQIAEELSAAALRAMTGRPGLHFEGRRLYDAEKLVPVGAPHLQWRSNADPASSSRGIADALAMRLAYSSPGLHTKLAPKAPVEGLIFDWLEQLRCESLTPSTLPGTRRNLITHYRNWTSAFLASGMTETSLGILLFALSQIVWSRLMGEALSQVAEDVLEPTRMALAPGLGEAFVGIRRWRHEQERYADYALRIANDIARRVREEVEAAGPDVRSRRSNFTLSLDASEASAERFMTAQSGDSAVFSSSGGLYKVYTKRYDRIVEAVDLVRPALLAAYRRELDDALALQGMNTARLARALSAVLARPQRDGWRFGEEEGIIDGRRLAQVVSSPAERRVFRRDQYLPLADCTASFLIDCSGSMKQHGLALAMMMDIFMRALEQAGVATEILGYTTLAWNGGRARQDWLAQGRAAHPGRLNEVCHLVFKDAETSWRRARSRIVALMKPDLFREGIDGEAVQWACERLLRRDRRRRILVVVSDGCPMDSATQLVNDDFYLDNHLKAVLRQYGAMPGMDIIGLGVGLDLSPYYQRSLAVDLSDGLKNTMFDDMLRLLSGRRRR
jgi:cobaltochelatase CobT